MLAVGFTDSIVKVWTLVPQKLKAMKSAEQLQDVNIEADDVLVSALSLFFTILHYAAQNFLQLVSSLNQFIKN